MEQLKPSRTTLALLDHYEQTILLLMDISRTCCDGAGLEYFKNQLDINLIAIKNIRGKVIPPVETG